MANAREFDAMWSELSENKFTAGAAQKSNVNSASPPPPAIFTNDISFDVRSRGYDRKQVEDYIDAVTTEFNDMCKKLEETEAENRGLRKALAALELRDPPRAYAEPAAYPGRRRVW